MAFGSAPATIRIRVLCAAVLLAGALPLAAQSKLLDIFQDLRMGEWTVKYRDGSPDQKLCLKSGEELIQLKHRRSDCSRFVVEDGLSLIHI